MGDHLIFLDIFMIFLGIFLGGPYDFIPIPITGDDRLPRFISSQTWKIQNRLLIIIRIFVFAYLKHTRKNFVISLQVSPPEISENSKSGGGYL